MKTQLLNSIGRHAPCADVRSSEISSARMRRRYRAALLAAAAACGLALSAHANTLTVTNLADVGEGSIREAIAGADPRGATINFAVTGTITLTNGALEIGKNLDIVGPGAKLLILDGNHSNRVFTIQADAAVSMSGLTISNGLARGADAYIVVIQGASYRAQPGQGGGILNSGVLSIASCVVISNSAVGGNGLIRMPCCLAAMARAVAFSMLARSSPTVACWQETRP